MSSAPQPGDEIPDSLRQELIDAIEAEKRLFPQRLLSQALEYARRYLDMEKPTLAALWNYILDRLQLTHRWRYAQLDDFPDRFGYALQNADGRRLYLKLCFNDESWVVVLSFHEGH